MPSSSVLSVDCVMLMLAAGSELGASVGTVADGGAGGGGAGGVEGGTQALGDGAESFASPSNSRRTKHDNKPLAEPLLQLPADVDDQASPKKFVRYHGSRNRLGPSSQVSVWAAYGEEIANGPVIKQLLPEANIRRRWMPTRCGIHVVPVISAAKFIRHGLDHGRSCRTVLSSETSSG